MNLRDLRRPQGTENRHKGNQTLKMATFMLVGGCYWRPDFEFGRVRCGECVLKRKKLRRGSHVGCSGEKSPGQDDDDIVPGNTLTGRQASGGIGTFRKRGTPVDSRLEQNLIFLKKGNRGMPMKPIGRFQWLPKTSKGSEASRG